MSCAQYSSPLCHLDIPVNSLLQTLSPPAASVSLWKPLSCQSVSLLVYWDSGEGRQMYFGVLWLLSFENGKAQVVIGSSETGEQRLSGLGLCDRLV